VAWSGADGFRFGQVVDATGDKFIQDLVPVDDAANEVAIYGGVFRGRPVTFRLEMTAPLKNGNMETQWSMRRSTGEWFGEKLTVPIKVRGIPASAADWWRFE
jgi:hypothetical protein